MPQGHRLDDADREYRRVLGVRMERAAALAGLGQTRIGELIGQPASNVGQFYRGARRVSPDALDRFAQVTGVAVDDLLAAEDAPMAVRGPDGICPAGFVIEAAFSRVRVAVLLICDKRHHQGDHHDPRGLAWRSAPGI